MTEAVAAAPPHPEAFLCRVTNPSQRARVFYDGVKNDKAIYLPPGQMVEVALADHMIDKLTELETADPEEAGLHVVELGPAPEPAPPPPPVRPARRQRPARAA